jgi:hypothetical protein
MLLSERQAAFAGAIWHDDGVSAIGATPAGRFAIYRNNVFASLIGVLAARYPVVQRLLGEECFRGCCLRFVSEHPPCSPVLAEYGGDFAVFLGNLTDLAALPYLADIARLEWACHEALHGADAAVLVPDVLGAIAPDRAADLTFGAHPTVHLLRSAYPIHSIWRTNMFDAVTRVIAAEAAGEAVLVSRVNDEVSVVALSPSSAAFAAALFGGATLTDALLVAAAVEVTFAVAPALAILLRAHALTAYEVDAQRTRNPSC